MQLTAELVGLNQATHIGFIPFKKYLIGRKFEAFISCWPPTTIPFLDILYILLIIMSSKHLKV